MTNEPRDENLDDEPEAGLPPRGDSDSDSDSDSGLDADTDSDSEGADEAGEAAEGRAGDGPDRLHGLIGYILGQIVSRPDEVKIELAESDKRRVYEVRVAADDVGVVIGRSGRTINAIRTLLRGVPDAPERVWVELIEEDEGRGRRPRRDAPEPRFDDEGAEGEERDGVAREPAANEGGDDRDYQADRDDRDDRDARDARDDQDAPRGRDDHDRDERLDRDRDAGDNRDA